jgi:hypothetical protein
MFCGLPVTNRKNSRYAIGTPRGGVKQVPKQTLKVFYCSRHFNLFQLAMTGLEQMCLIYDANERLILAWGRSGWAICI